MRKYRVVTNGIKFKVQFRLYLMWNDITTRDTYDSAKEAVEILRARARDDGGSWREVDDGQAAGE